MAGIDSKPFAQVTMFATADGGLKQPVETPTPSFLFAFAGQEEMAEAMITTEGGGPLVPGRSHRIRLAFWTDASAAEARPGREFSLWHGRLVGSGRFD